VERVDVLMHSPRYFAYAGHVCRREQQILRIDVAGLHECPRFLRTAAWIRLVDQSTLLVHEVMEIPPCPRELLPEVVAAHLQQLGPDAVRDVEDVAQDVNEPLLAIQTQQHARGAANGGFVDEKLHICGNRARVRKLQIWSALELPTVFHEGP